MKQILLAEDDIDLGNILKQFLEISGHSVSWVQDGIQALELLRSTLFHACIIDIMMPNMDGFVLAEKIAQSYPGLPFIFLTAKNLKEDRLKGLILGADDYIVKPFEVDELLLRLRNVLKRSEQNLDSKKQITIGTYRLDCNRLQLHFHDGFVQLTEMEIKIILHLYENRNQMLKRSDILRVIWKTDDYFTGRSFDVFLSRVRKYFQKDNSVSIISVRNVGVEFRVS